MKIIYPAIFYQDKKCKGFYVEFPDLPGCLTEGEDLEESYAMAEEALGLYLASRLDAGLETKAPSPFGKLKSKEGIVCYISADPGKYRKNGRSIKKTLTIPEWLNTEAEKTGVNFSAVLQEALRLKLEI